jgi:Mn-dependent DtxR family transcriptional regulator
MLLLVLKRKGRVMTDRSRKAEKTRQIIVDDVLQHAPGWGQQNIIDDLKLRLDIEPAETLSIIGLLIEEGVLEREDSGFISLKSKGDKDRVTSRSTIARDNLDL